MSLDDLALGVGLLALAVLLGLAGCLDDEPERTLDREVRVVDADVNETVRGGDEYWMVSVTGSEADEDENQPVCDRRAPDFDVRPANRSVVYEEEAYGFDAAEVATLVAFDHEDKSSGCPEAEHLVANPEAEHVQAMGGYGDLALTVHANGTLTVDGHRVRLGQAAEVTYEGRPAEGGHVTGDFRVVNLGAWPTDRLQAGRP